MTREEALEKIKAEIRMYEEESLESVEWEECYETLKQEPCEDAVSREDALKSLIDNTDFEGWELSQALEAIEKLPSVTQKSGYWITKEAYSEDKAMGFTEQIVCSNCDMQNSYFSEWDECKNPISKTFIRSKFCPNCGAKMVEPQESEE